MPDTQLLTLRQTDSAVDAALRQIWRDLGEEPACRIAYTFFDGAAPVQVQLEAEIPSSLQPILDLSASALVGLRLDLPGRQNAYVSVTRAGPHDDVRYGMPVGPNAEPSLQFVAAVRRAFKPADPAGALDRFLGPELAEFYSRREQTLFRLEDALERVVEGTSSYRAQLDADAAAERERIRAEAQAREDETQRRLAERAAELAAREDALAQAKRELDDRSSTHARRKLREDLLAAIRKSTSNFHLSESTAKKRWPAQAAFVLAGGALLTAAALSFWRSETDPTWIPLARFGVSALSFLGLAVFYIRWQDGWAQAHAQEEFTQRRLELDVDRASWVVEVGLEWKDEKGTPMPPELLDRLTSNLFQVSADQASVRHPSQDIAAALFQSAASARIGIPGLGEVTLDRPGMKRFGKAAAGGSEV